MTTSLPNEDVKSIRSSIKRINEELGCLKKDFSDFKVSVESRLAAIETNLKWMKWFLLTVAASLLGLLFNSFMR